MRKTFQTGLESRVALKSESVDSNSALITGMNPYYRSYVQIDLAQPVLRDAGITVNTASLRMARNQSGQSEYALLERTQELAEKIELTYYDLAQAREVLGQRHRFSWPWFFYINVPVGIINLLLVQRFMVSDPPLTAQPKGSMDLPGLLLLAVGLGSLQLMLEKGHREDWLESDFIHVLAVLTVAGLALFVWRELRTRRSAVNLRLLKNATFTAGTLMGGCLGVALFANLFLVPMFLQQLMGYPALDAGLLLMPRSLAMAVAMPLAGRLYNRLGPRPLITVGMLVTAYSFWDFGRLSLDVSFMDLLIPQVWQGLGFDMIFVALSTVSLSQVPRPQITAASGLYNVVRQVAGSIGTAWAATALTSNTGAYRGELGQHLTPYADRVQHWLASVADGLSAAGSSIAQAPAQALKLLAGQLERQAAMLAFNRVFFMFLIMFLACLPLVLLLRKSREAAVPAEAISE